MPPQTSKTSRKQKERRDGGWEMESVTSHGGSPTNSPNSSFSINDPVEEVEQKDSMEELDERSDIEKTLFDLVDAEDRAGIRAFYKENISKIDINKRDRDGEDLLTHAIKTDNEKLLNLVLNLDPEGINITQVLLTVVKENRMGLLLKLLYFDDSRKKGPIYAATQQLLADPKRGKTKQTPLFEFDQSEYGNDITPFVMAANCGHFEIMQVLYNRGERLPTLHFPSCDCPDCKKETRDLEKIQRRLHLLSAQSNAWYLVLMAGQDGSFDPVHESFLIIANIQRCVDEEPEFQEEYETILEEIKKFPVELLMQCRTSDEAKLFLSQREGFVGGNVKYPRLSMAIDCEIKEFVACPTAQYLLYQDWVGFTWNTRSTSEYLMKMLVTLLAMVLFPIVNLYLWLALFCCSSSSLTQFLLSPLNRCLSKFASHVTFCILLIYMNCEDRAEADITPPTMYIRWIIIIYVTSYIVQLAGTFFHNPVGFYKKGWNIVDLVTMILFLITIGFWIELFIRSEEMEFEHMISRRQLESTDPLLLGECFLAVATTLTSLRLLRVFILQPIIGPLVITMKKMAEGVKSFGIFFLLIIPIFGLGIQILFRPYKGLTKLEKNETKYQPESYLSFSEGLESWFWSSFGGISPSNLEIFPVEKMFEDENHEMQTVENKQKTTQVFANVIGVVYQTIAVMFMMGLVTGTMTGVQEELDEDKEQVEWKFSRSQEWLYYISDSYLAPPFNLLPHGSFLLTTLTWVSSLSGSSGGKQSGCSLEQCCYIRDVESPNDQGESHKQYPFLMRLLFQRYFKHMAWTDGDDKKPLKGDVIEIHSAIKEIREMAKNVVDKAKGDSGKKQPAKGQPSKPSQGHPPKSKEVKTAQSQQSTVPIEVVMSPKPTGILSP